MIHLALEACYFSYIEEIEEAHLQEAKKRFAISRYDGVTKVTRNMEWGNAIYLTQGGEEATIEAMAGVLGALNI
jgi:hypothetical protein